MWVPEGVDETRVRKTVIQQFGIEITRAFGPLKGNVWRIGTMGYSCRWESILKVLGALETTLIYHGAKVNRGEALQTALGFYAAKVNSDTYIPKLCLGRKLDWKPAGNPISLEQIRWQVYC